MKKLTKKTIDKIIDLFANDKNGARSINVGLRNKETVEQLIGRAFKRRPGSADVRVIRATYMNDKIAIENALNDRDMIQVVSKETVRTILNNQMLNFLNEVMLTVGSDESEIYDDISEYDRDEMAYMNDCWDGLKKKERKFLLGKAQQLKDVIESFQIRVHDLSFKFLLYITSK